jgi:hypothetical protein
VGASGISFSSRFHWDSERNPLTDLLGEKRRANAHVLDLAESNPTHAGFTYPKEEILAAISDARALRYEPDPRGMLSAREAVSRYYAAHGVQADPSRIVLTASTSEAYTYLFKLLMNPGDEVLVPRPSYPLFEYLAAMESVAVRQYPLRYDGGWHIDFAALEVAAGPRTRAIVVVNPNNPTGSFLKREEWARLRHWATARKLAILSDEVFSDFAFAPDTDRIATLAGESGGSLVFAMSGLSKIAGLPQMKLGWIVAGGEEHVRAINGLEWIADTFLSVATPVQLGLERLLAATESVRSQIRERTAGNLRLAKETFGASSLCRILSAEGGWNIVIQVPRTRSEDDWTLGLLREADVYVQPGYFYDFESEAYLVASLLTEPGAFREGLRRLSGYVDA